MGKVLYPKLFKNCPSQDASLIWPTSPLSTIQLGPVSLDTAMAIYWRVKEWNLYSSKTQTDYEPGNPGLLEYIPGTRFPEEKVFCGDNEGQFYYVAVPPSSGPNSEFIQVGFYFFWSGAGVVQIGDDYWLQIGALTPGIGTLLDNVGIVDEQKLRFYWEFLYIGSIYRLEIYPKEYFSYGGTWDTSTGQRL